jgi:hypothetical protein
MKSPEIASNLFSRAKSGFNGTFRKTGRMINWICFIVVDSDRKTGSDSQMDLN